MSFQPKIGNLSRGSFSSPLFVNATPFEDLDSLFAADPCDVLVVDLPPVKHLGVLQQLRAHSVYQFALIYVAGMLDPLAQGLADGAPPEREEDVTAQHQQLRQRLAAFNKGQPPELFEHKVMAWLWTRPETQLRPVKDPRSPHLYHFPLLDVFAGSEQNVPFALQLLVEKNYLEPLELLDRLRCCTDCSSSRLNYIDVCPECSAIEVERQPSLHCFTCGHVAAQEKFHKDSILLCPNCYTRLRHIGSDYDRPMENFRCQACRAFFIDASVEARCLDCGQPHAPEALRVREVRPYRLTEEGRMKCREGFHAISYADNFNTLNLVGQATFRNLLNWQVQQVRRYKNPPFTLVILRFVNLQATLREMDNSKAVILVDTLVERIRDSIRDTDRCCRTSEEKLMLLLSHTDAQGAAALYERLRHLQELFPQDQYRLDLRIAQLTLPDELLAEEDGGLLMARLDGEVS